MKICAISDIHGRLDLIPECPKCDVLCICGDVVDLNVQRDTAGSLFWWLETFAKWVIKQPCDKVIIIPGNHDIVIERLVNGESYGIDAFKEKLLEATGHKAVILIDELYEYEGKTFYGTPWIQPIHWQSWAFEDVFHEYDEYVCPFEKILKCDILLTHDNPNYNEKLEHCCFGKYKHHFFGHWHDGISYGHLRQYNCSVLNDNYSKRKNLKIVTVDDED